MSTQPTASSLKALYDEAFQCIQDAVKFKQMNQLNLSYDLYVKGIGHFMQIVKVEPDPNKQQTVKKHVTRFMNEAETLKQQLSAQPSALNANSFAPSAPSLDILNLPEPPSSNIHIDLPDPPSGYGHEGETDTDDDGHGADIFDRAQSQLDAAIEQDQHKQYVEALSKYKIASQMFLNGIKLKALSMSKAEKTKYRDKVSTIVGRCELLNKLITKQQQEAASRVNNGVIGEALSAKELRILRNSSFIRTLELLPWIDADDHSIEIGQGQMYRDPAGLLPLSEKQKKRFSKWKRLKNIAKGKPTIVYSVSPYSITQTLITDCSFVSSITVCALHEQMFGKQLITKIIYPQRQMAPVYNSDGQYAVKLFINGCARKVLIDDYLPISVDAKLLCSYSNNPNEFWVSLIEKAFLKVMGGYDFPGSTSCEDLHVLTGWIPERVGLNDDDKDFNLDTFFDRLVSGYKYGDCLITLSSKQMSEEDAESWGLVPTHAYAVLRVVRLGAHKFMLIKNPWAEKRWTGRFSANDDKNWTPQLRKALNYDPEKERQFDNGIFWMNTEEIVQHFSAVFLNWNPDLFSFRITQHGFWSKSVGPKNDSYNFGYNPQYTLDCDVSSSDCKENNGKESMGEGGSTWILLSKHMENSKRQEQDKNDFLTIHVYDESAVNTRDRRVFHRKGALYTGTYINSPHYLMRIDVNSNCSVPQQQQQQQQPKGKQIRRYTIVVSQFEKKHDVAFTITAYSTLPARFKPIDDAKLWRYQKVFTGAWNEKYCGGSPNHDTFPQNPQFKITTFYKTHLRFLLEAPIEYSVNIQLYLCANQEEEEEQSEGGIEASNYDDNQVNLMDNDGNPDEMEQVDDAKKAKGGKILSRKDYSKDLLVGDSGAYRYGVCMTDVLNVERGTYIAIISTFKPQQIGGFKFTVKSVENLQLRVV